MKSTSAALRMRDRSLIMRVARSVDLPRDTSRPLSAACFDLQGKARVRKTSTEVCQAVCLSLWPDAVDTLSCLGRQNEAGGGSV